MDDAAKEEATADIFSEFLELAVHGILYSRALYPQGVFGRKKKYNIPVQVCLHPEVSRYVSQVCEAVRCLLLQGAVHQVDVVITTNAGQALEKFVFDLGSRSADARVNDDQYFLRLENSLRAMLLKLYVSDALLQPLPAECSWTIHVHTKESAAASLDEQLTDREFPWVEAEELEQKLEKPKIIPLKSLHSYLFRMQMYAEESTKKL